MLRKVVTVAALCSLLLFGVLGVVKVISSIREGPPPDQVLVSDQIGRADSMVADVTASEDNHPVAARASVVEVGTGSVADAMDRVGIVADDPVSHPLLAYPLMALILVVAATAAGWLNLTRIWDYVKHSVNDAGKIGGAALRQSLGVVGTAAIALGSAIIAIGASSRSTLAGNGSYLGEEGGSFWLLVVLAAIAGTIVFAGGLIARRAGK